MQLLKKRANSTRRRASTTDEQRHDALETTRTFVSSLDLSHYLKCLDKKEYDTLRLADVQSGSLLGKELYTEWDQEN